MSAPQYRIPLKFRALMRDRDCSVAKLAAEAGLPIRRVQNVLAAHPLASAEDRRAIAPCLTMAEHVALGWAWNGALIDQLFAVEQSEPCSTALSAQPTNP